MEDKQLSQEQKDILDSLVEEYFKQAEPPWHVFNFFVEVLSKTGNVSDDEAHDLLWDIEGIVGDVGAVIEFHKEQRSKAAKLSARDASKGEATCLARADGIEPFALLPGEVHDAIMELSLVENRVLTELAFHRNKVTGLAAPGLKRLSDRTRFSQRHVNDALASLQDRKLIRFHGGGYRGTNTQWHVFGPGTEGPCPSCKVRKATGGRPKLSKVAV